MTAFLYHRLARSGLVPRETLVRALGRSLVRRTSLCEALIALDVVHARSISEVLSKLGPSADEGWRPDPGLLADLPPGMCEQYLTFPFRERGFGVELSTLCPLDETVQREFEWHLKRPVTLYRARLQALLAAANAPVDLEALARFLSQPPPSSDGAPLPLLRKNQRTGAKKRARVPTSPGLGGNDPEDHGSPDTAAAGRTELDLFEKHELISESKDVFELAAALGLALPPPTLIFEHTQDKLYLRITTGEAAYQDEVVSLDLPSALAEAHAQGEYWGPFYASPAHARFHVSFPRDTVVFIARLGGRSHGLVVVCSGQVGVHEARSLLETARRRAAMFLQ